MLVVEVGLRLAGYQPKRVLGAWRAVNSAHTLALDCYPSNPRGYFDIDLRNAQVRAHYEALGLEGLATISVRTPFAVEYRYNSLGFRDRELTPRREGLRRLVILGDSFTEGQGVKAQDAVAGVLERLLNERQPGSWEVWNAGRRGSDFPRLFDSFERVLEAQPDVVVYGMVLNDAVQGDGFRLSQAYVNDWIVDRTGQRPAPHSPLRLLDLARDAVDSYRIGRQTTAWYRGLYSAANSDGWAETQRYLKRMNRQSRERGVVFIVALWPLFVHLDAGYPFADASATVSEACRALGIEEHDLRTAFSGHSAAELTVHPLDLHPNEKAHALVARYLLPIVQAH